LQAAEYRQWIQRERPEVFNALMAEIAAERKRVLDEVKLPAKTPDGIRQRAVHHIGELYRARNFKIADDTVDHCLDRYRARNKRLSQEP
jgi:hypothetical protein